eukprot:3115123-Prymnesium_polylepis.5
MANAKAPSSSMATLTATPTLTDAVSCAWTELGSVGSRRAAAQLVHMGRRPSISQCSEHTDLPHWRQWRRRNGMRMPNALKLCAPRVTAIDTAHRAVAASGPGRTCPTYVPTSQVRPNPAVQCGRWPMVAPGGGIERYAAL